MRGPRNGVEKWRGRMFIEGTDLSNMVAAGMKRMAGDSPSGSLFCVCYYPLLLLSNL